MKPPIAAAAFALAFMMPLAAFASCVCRCVDGQMQPLCSRTGELRPTCPVTLCDIVPPSTAPYMLPEVPPIGTTSCRMAQVMDPGTEKYEWQRVCE